MSSIDAVWIRIAMDLLLIAANLSLFIYTVISNKTKANREAIESMDARMDKMDLRLTRIERDVENLPNNDDIGGLHEKVNDIATALAGVASTVNGLSANFQVIYSELAKGVHSK